MTPMSEIKITLSPWAQRRVSFSRQRDASLRSAWQPEQSRNL